MHSQNLFTRSRLSQKAPPATGSYVVQLNAPAKALSGASQGSSSRNPWNNFAEPELTREIRNHSGHEWNPKRCNITFFAV